MGVRNNKNVGLYSGSLYVLSVIAAMSLYLGDGKKASAMVGRMASGVTRSLSRASSIISSTGSASAVSSRVSARNINGALQQSGSELPTHKVQHKFGATAETFVPVGNIDPNKKYTQYVSDSGTLKTYERNLGTRFEIFLSDTKVGRDKYIDPTTGRVVSYIYRSKPRWITGADILNAQQSKAQETSSIASGVSGSSGVTSLYSSRLNLQMIKNSDGGINFVEKLPEVKVNNPDIIKNAQQIADKLKVNDQNASTGSSVVSGGSATSGTGIGNTATSSLKLQMVKNQDGNVNFVQETPKVKVNNPDIIQKAQQIANKFKVTVNNGLDDRTKATQTDKIQVSSISTQTDKQGTQQSSVGTVKVSNPQVIIPAGELANKLKVKETLQGSTTTIGSQTSKIITSNAQTQSTTKLSSDKSSQTEGNVTYRTELRVQVGGTSTAPDYTTSVKNITLKIPVTSDTIKDVTKLTGTDTKMTQQQTSTGGTVKVNNPQVIDPATKIAGKLKVEEPSKSPTITQTTITPSTGTGTSGQTAQKFTSTVTITPSPAPRTTTTNIKTQDKTGSSQNIDASGQKKNIETSFEREKVYTPFTTEISDAKSKLKPVSTSGSTITSVSSSSGTLVKSKDVSRKDVDLQKDVKINTDNVSGKGSVEVLTKYFETKNEEIKKPKASNTKGIISINVESKDGKVKVSSKTEEVTLTDTNVSNLKVNPDFVKDLNKKLAEGYPERLAQAEKNFKQSIGTSS